MYATQDLRNEHEGVKVALAVLDYFSNEIRTERVINLGDLELLIDFLKTFVDRCHHGKEEDLLFPALEKAGIPRENGAIDVMLADHTQGREYIRIMNEAIPGLREGDPESQSTFVSAARGYSCLLHNHIVKENEVLFVMAEQNLTPQVHEELVIGFDKIEQERIGPGVHERYHALLDRLSNEYLEQSS